MSPQSLAEAQLLYARIVIEPPNHDYIFGIAFNNGNFYVIAAPRASLTPITNEPYYLLADEAYYVSINGRVGDQIESENIKLMSDGNRWEWA